MQSGEEVSGFLAEDYPSCVCYECICRALRSLSKNDDDRVALINIILNSSLKQKRAVQLKSTTSYKYII